MCGIAGIFSLDGRAIENIQQRINNMTMRLIHRGPDYQGTFVSEDRNFAFGNTRLAISDPNNNIPQPMVTPDKRGVLTFNGELYNDLELRRKLEAQHIQFESNLDTEVLLKGLCLQGEKFLPEIDGMWAFAFYDFSSRQLLLSRDLLGERQLFYRLTKNELLFASEIAPILADSKEYFDLDFNHLFSALRFGAAPPGQTIIHGIKKLRAGHNLMVKQNAKPVEYRYRRLHPEKWFNFFNNQPTLNQVINTFDEVFNLACRRRIPREVPYVSTLSGGLDSTTVCVYASNFGHSEIDTLYAWSDYTPDKKLPDDIAELEASQLTSNIIGSNHHVYQIDTPDCIPVLERVAANAYDGMLDEGTASFEMLGWRGRDLDKKVILISDGPDEFLGGYNIDKAAYQRDRLENWTYKPGHNVYFQPFHQIYAPTMLKKAFTNPKEIERTSGFGTIDVAYQEIISEMDTSQLRALAYASTSIPDYCNLRADKGFLRAAIESRSPFLAPDMVEFMIAMPASLRFDKDNTTTKYLMRKIVERHVDPRVAWRSKHGFSAPLWFAPTVQKKLRFDETIKESPLLKELPFSPSFLEAPFEPPFHKLRWSLFSIIKVCENLRSKNYLYSCAPS